MARPAIRLHTNGLEPSAGASKLGGAPDLPAGWDWPTAEFDVVGSHEFAGPRGELALPFIAQIRLSEVPPCLDRQGLLPRVGMLYFFYEDAWFSRRDWQQPHTWRVLYCEEECVAPAPEFPASLPAEGVRGCPNERRFASQALTFGPQLDLPSVETSFIGAHGSDPLLDEAQWEFYADGRSWLAGQGPQHKLLGHSDDSQPGAMESYPEAWSVAGRPWQGTGRLLLQVGGGPFPLWFGRGGLLFFFIQDQDLAARDFDRVWALSQ